MDEREIRLACLDIAVRAMYRDGACFAYDETALSDPRELADKFYDYVIAAPGIKGHPSDTPDQNAASRPQVNGEG